VKRVLFLSYHFPPIGGSGAQRPARMVRYLRDHGFESVVITASRPLGERWTPADEELMAEIPSDVDVRRVPWGQPPSNKGWRGRTERWLRRTSPWARSWIEGQLALGREVARTYDFDLVYAWMQPYSSGEPAAILARELHTPWVADLGDPWGLDEMMIYPTGVHRALELRKMRSVLGEAAAIVMSTPEAALAVRRSFPEFSSKPVLAIPNGFDEGDFEAPVTPRDDSVFRIVHTGYLHTELGEAQHRRSSLRRLLGGAAVPGVDILTRSHLYLLRAIDRAIELNPSLASTIELHLAGVLSSRDLAIAERSEAVRIHGFVSHAESVSLMRTADLLFLPMQNLPAGARARVVPGKTYEYLASGTPILAAVPDGDARDILAEAGNAILCRPDDVEAMARAILNEVERRRASTPPPAPRAEVLARFEYRALAGKLAEVFDTVLGKQAASSLARAEEISGAASPA
jgi:glycosyltransferase involved in cell wall biosynthesis